MSSTLSEMMSLSFMFEVTNKNFTPGRFLAIFITFSYSLFPSFPMKRICSLFSGRYLISLFQKLVSIQKGKKTNLCANFGNWIEALRHSPSPRKIKLLFIDRKKI